MHHAAKIKRRGNLIAFPFALIKPSHTTHKTAKTAVIFHTHYDFFSQLQQFFQQFYIQATISQRFFGRKILVVLCVMCQGRRDSNDQVWFNIFGFMTKFCDSSLLGTWEKCRCSAHVLGILNHLFTNFLFFFITLLSSTSSNKRIWCLFIMVCYVMYVIFNYLHVWEKSEPMIKI